MAFKVSIIKIVNVQLYRCLKSHRNDVKALKNIFEYVEEPDKDESTRSKRSAASDYRIVGGYTAAKTKPWVVKLWQKQYQILCGASVINKRYLLTASHCVCTPYMPCAEGKPAYIPSEHLVAYLGINSNPIEVDNSNYKGEKSFEYEVVAVLAHPDYQGGSKDIAIAKLARDITFIPGILEPICLPSRDDRSDIPASDKFHLGEKLYLYVAGWGKTIDSCTTNEYGPMRNLKCELPFIYKDRIKKTCSRSRSPSAFVDICADFRSKLPNLYPKEIGQHIVIEKEGHSTVCYSTHSGDFGWCKVIETDREFDDNWGWCKESCSLFAENRGTAIEFCN